MTKNELKKFKEILQARQAELELFVRNREGIAIEKSPDALDEVQYAGERELAIRSLHRESTLLRIALARLAGGTYGACLHCDEEISTRRLTAAPWSTYCLKCQEAADRREFEVVDVPDSFIADAA